MGLESVLLFHRQGKELRMKTVLCALFVCHMALGAIAGGTCNPNANWKTKKIYEAMSRPGKLLSGAFGGWTGTSDPIKFGLEEENKIKQFTGGKSPLIYGLDCCPGWLTAASGKETDLVECYHPEFAKYGKEGGLLTISHLLPNPFYPGNNQGNWVSAANLTVSNKDFYEIFREGSAVRGRWISSLYKVAKALTAYQNQDITILYRPFREQNGEWFWWGALKWDLGNQERMQIFKRLWIDVYNYMTYQWKLNNLLWVYAPDDGRDFKQGFYPGNQYVDFACVDWYTDNYYSMTGYYELISTGKPFCLAEVGGRNNIGNFDYNQLVNALRSNYPKTSFFLSWNGEHSPTTNKGAWGAYHNPAVVSRWEFNY